MSRKLPVAVTKLHPSQWLTFIGANAISKLHTFIPWLKHWSWYCFRRALLICTAIYAVDVFWLGFKRRKLGVTIFRELALMHWVPPGMFFDKDTKMRVFLRQCGYNDVTGARNSEFGKQIEPWFYGEAKIIKDETNQILEKMEAKAMKQALLARTSQAEEMQAVTRVLKNFKEFSAEEIMEFFKASELLEMEKGERIFSAEDTEEYFYSVVSGEIHLFCDGIGTTEAQLVKVSCADECIVSLLSFLHNFTVGPQTYSDLQMYAVCDVPGKYYRVPISKLVEYTGDQSKMYEVISNVLIRHQSFCMGLNDLTGILPRLHRQIFLDAHYTDIHLEPGILTGTKLANEAFESLVSILPIMLDDRKLCWVGVLDSGTVLLRRFKKTHYAFYVYQGLLACTVSKLRRSYNSIQFYLPAGQMVGWREAMVGIDMAVQYQVADNAKAFVIAVPDYILKRYCQRRPELFKPLIVKLLDRDSFLMRQISYTLRFTSCQINEAIYGRGDLEADTASSAGIETYGYLCLSGRLRFLTEQDSVRTTVPNIRRYGIIEKGDWFGLMAMYTDDAGIHRTVICDRCCDYVVIPRYIMSIITKTFREASGYQCDYLARAIDRDHEHTFLDTDKMSDTQYQLDHFGVHTSRTYRVICVYPSSPDIPGKVYCDELARHHTSSAMVVTRTDALEAMKVSEFTLNNEYYLAKWLVAQEEGTTALFILANNDCGDHWNATVAKLCDMIHILVTYNAPYKPTEGENNVLQLAKKARKELVFIHPVVRVTKRMPQTIKSHWVCYQQITIKAQIGPAKFPHLPQGSVLWLRPRRSWVQRHHHVRMLDSAFKYEKEKDPQDLYRYLADTKNPDKHSDFARVMRWISGQSIGIVLGGGGAKGAAHLGTLHYLKELDVPVDYIAGVSIGSFLGALYAVYENIIVVESKAKELWENLKNPVRFARDITLNPMSALFRGHSFNWMIHYFFGDIQIEDLYIPYFCVSTDLNDNCSRTHMTGDLWFYVRASMTLTMVFPPQINQFDYHLLMDGGYSDLVPAMTMRKLGIKYLVAINIGSETSTKTFNFGYHVSGLKCLLQSCMPYSIDPVPNHFDFWDAILFCSAKNFINILKAMDEYCIYIRPNINAYSGTDFQYYDEIKRLGYLSTKFKFGGLRLKNQPVHVIWYLLRFYTYPFIAQSQSQMLQGFKDEDWEFAINLMSKTQMYLRAKTPFLKMNLTPYLTDLMEARSYLEKYINDDDDFAELNLNVPMLENFSRDDEKLDLTHAIAKMKEWNYMEDFESIVARKTFNKEDFVIHTRVHAVTSQIHDLANARQQYEKSDDHEHFHNRPVSNREDLDNVFGAVKETYSIKDLYLADPSIFEAVASYRHLQNRSLRGDDIRRRKAVDEGAGSVSRIRFHQQKTERKAQGKRSIQAIKDIIYSITRPLGKLSRKEREPSPSAVSRPAEKGQRLAEYRKHLTSADKKSMEVDEKMIEIITLNQLRRSFRHNNEIPQL